MDPVQTMDPWLDELNYGGANQVLPRSREDENENRRVQRNSDSSSSFENDGDHSIRRVSTIFRAMTSFLSLMIVVTVIGTIVWLIWSTSKRHFFTPSTPPGKHLCSQCEQMFTCTRPLKDRSRMAQLDRSEFDRGTSFSSKTRDIRSCCSIRLQGKSLHICSWPCHCKAFKLSNLTGHRMGGKNDHTGKKPWMRNIDPDFVFNAKEEEERKKTAAFVHRLQTSSTSDNFWSDSKNYGGANRFCKN
jgi:hypothetical protein